MENWIALVDRWRPETHTFHFRLRQRGGGGLTPTLKDVSMITGLPISGKSFVPPPNSINWRKEVEDRLLIRIPNTKRSRGPQGVPIGRLHTNCHEVPLEQLPHETLMRHLFAHLLYLFGMSFPLSHGDVVIPSLVKIAEQIVDGPLHDNPLYSFGFAVLSHT